MAITSAMSNGVSGLNSFSTALEVTSDNVANTGTTAYKSNAVRFGDMVSSYYNTQSKDTDRRGAGSVVLGVATDFAQGPFTNTTSWCDMAVNGQGYFNLAKYDSDTKTIDAQVFYTRDGSFHVDKSGALVNYQGYAVLGQDDQPIFVEPTPETPSHTNFYVDSKGQIWGYPVDGTSDPEPIGAKIKMVIFPNEGGLIRKGGNLYTNGPESKTPIDVTDNQTLRGDIAGYTLEGSNVDLAKEMVNMIVYQSSYNANSKSITTGRDMLDTTINLVR